MCVFVRVVLKVFARRTCMCVNTALIARPAGSLRSNSCITQSAASHTALTDFYRNFSPRELTSYVIYSKSFCTLSYAIVSTGSGPVGFRHCSGP